ncbi:hypothetical protein BU14_0390s0002 [Porphyra umbilicalis]|uniref:Uncharacterized protein n=1 Tax=Porphyra umbilicalis TaxID=2786 RepID=A0A1X6NX40_PORUM|nr:hypothetical protein BU14_0390s0002 [Porphyra umbilicalis]|eukprot:OSX72963.1 hypothetical protein BU14_0390s0002 [Porphyra umbilicalis]
MAKFGKAPYSGSTEARENHGHHTCETGNKLQATACCCGVVIVPPPITHAVTSAPADDGSTVALDRRGVCLHSLVDHCQASARNAEPTADASTRAPPAAAGESRPAGCTDPLKAATSASHQNRRAQPSTTTATTVRRSVPQPDKTSLARPTLGRRTFILWASSEHDGDTVHGAESHEVAAARVTGPKQPAVKDATLRTSAACVCTSVAA